MSIETLYSGSNHIDSAAIFSADYVVRCMIRYNLIDQAINLVVAKAYGGGVSGVSGNPL